MNTTALAWCVDIDVPKEATPDKAVTEWYYTSQRDTGFSSYV